MSFRNTFKYVGLLPGTDVGLSPGATVAITGTVGVQNAPLPPVPNQPLVQSTTGAAILTTAGSVTFGAGTTNGTRVYAVAGWYSGGDGSTITAAAAGGVAGTRVLRSISADAAYTLEVWELVGVPAGTTTVTMTLSGSRDWTLAAVEVAGVASGVADRVAAAAPSPASTASPPTTGAITAGAAGGQLFLGAWAVTKGATSAPWTFSPSAAVWTTVCQDTPLNGNFPSLSVMFAVLPSGTAQVTSDQTTTALDWAGGLLGLL